MQDYIAIASSKVDEAEMKRSALLFDTIVIHGLDESIALSREIEDSGVIERMMAEMNARERHSAWKRIKRFVQAAPTSRPGSNRYRPSDQKLRLKEWGVIVDEGEFLQRIFGAETAEESKMGELLEFLSLTLEKGVRSDSGLTDWEKTDYKAISSEAAHRNCRSVVQRLRSERKIDAVALGTGDHASLSSLFAKGSNTAMHLTLEAIPEPDPYSTSWEIIREFREDRDARGKLAQFRTWINDLARKDLSPREIRDTLEALRYQYEQHMKLHKMKFRAGLLETIVVSTAEFAENMAKLQFGKLAKGLFSCRQEKLALLEAELSAPGKEIAYLYKVKSALG